MGDGNPTVIVPEGLEGAVLGLRAS